MIGSDRTVANFGPAQRPFYPYMPRTMVVLLTCWVAHTVLNFSEVGLDSFFKDKLEAWLTASSSVEEIAAKYIPAVDNVFSSIASTPFADRAYLMRNIVAMNWVVFILCLVLCSITFPFEIYRNSAIFIRRMEYTRLYSPFSKAFGPLLGAILRNRFSFLVINMLVFLFFFRGMFYGDIFTASIWKIYSNDLKLLFVIIIFLGLEGIYLGVVAACATALLHPAERTDIR